MTEALTIVPGAALNVMPVLTSSTFILIELTKVEIKNELVGLVEGGALNESVINTKEQRYPSNV